MDVSRSEALEMLNHMGKAWFVSRYVCDNMNSDERRWTNVSTARTVRQNYYEKTNFWYFLFLVEIVKTSETMLDKNEINMTGKEVRQLAYDALPEALKAKVEKPY